MEFDGYCEPLQLAFEYQGVQHYKLQRSWHTPEQFDWYRQRDAEKVSLCAENQVHLVVVPYYGNIEQELGDAIIHWKLETGHPL